MSTLKLIMEIGLGTLYAIGAVFNSVYTLGNGTKFYGAFLSGAWNEPARWLLRNVILPNTSAFTVLLILFEITVAMMILSRGDLVRPALLAGTGFCIVAAAVSSFLSTSSRV